MLISRYIFVLLANLKAPTAAPPAEISWVQHVVDPGTKPAATPAETGIVDHIIAVHTGGARKPKAH